MLAEVHAHGFDVSEPELGVFMYPGPDGRRPSDLARQCQASRQAMNYVLSGLEQRGYLERHVGPISASTVVHITERGREIQAKPRAAQDQTRAKHAFRMASLSNVFGAPHGSCTTRTSSSMRLAQGKTRALLTDNFVCQQT